MNELADRARSMLSVRRRLRLAPGTPKNEAILKMKQQKKVLIKALQNMQIQNKQLAAE
jgi:hypothetical protein